MHPDIMRQIAAQRHSDNLAQAHQARVAKWVRRHRARTADEIVIPPIPDYVDGTFRLAGDDAATRVTTSHTAA